MNQKKKVEPKKAGPKVAGPRQIDHADLQKMPLVELEALAYRLVVQINIANNSLGVIEQEIAKRVPQLNQTKPDGE
jgi:hypothetical protein